MRYVKLPDTNNKNMDGTFIKQIVVQDFTGLQVIKDCGWQDYNNIVIMWTDLKKKVLTDKDEALIFALKWSRTNVLAGWLWQPIFAL